MTIVLALKKKIKKKRIKRKEMTGLRPEHA